MKQYISLSFTLSFIIFMLPLARAEKVEALVSFSPETPAKANEVNQNFTNIATVVNNNDDRHIEDAARITANEAAIALLNSSVTVSAVGFRPQDDAKTFLIANDGYLSPQLPQNVVFRAALPLPAGVAITSVEALITDNSDAGYIVIALQHGKGPNSVSPITSFGTDGEGITGTVVRGTIVPDATVLAGPGDYYFIEASVNSDANSGTAVGFYSVTVTYQYP